MNNKKFFALSLLGLFTLVLAMNLVVAANNSIIGEKLGSYFDYESWQAGKGLGSTVAKILFTLLVFMAIFSIANKIPVFGSKKTAWIKWPFSIIVAYLSMAYVTPEEIYAAMWSYSALGLVISAGIPFMILVAFTFSLATSNKNRSAQHNLANKALAFIMWFAFLVFIAFKALGASGADTIWYIVAVLLALGVVLFFGPLWRMISKVEEETTAEAADRTERAATRTTRRRAAAEDAEAEGGSAEAATDRS